MVILRAVTMLVLSGINHDEVADHAVVLSADMLLSAPKKYWPLVERANSKSFLINYFICHSRVMH
jgi:hypothetical protein